jgi:DNA-binding NarL/FixJ family response regulator
MLVELSLMEQRYQAVLAVVQDGWKVTEVAERLGVSRQSCTPGSPATRQGD